MTQNVLDYSQNPSGAELMDTFLAGMAENQLTNHSGTSRPSYAQPGTFWIDTTTNPWVLKQFTGTNDIVIGTLDQTGLAFVARRALQDGGGNNIGETYLTKTGTAARATADANGNVITSTYLTTSGTAARATADASGNNIANTYATKTELNQKSSFKLFHHDWFDYELNDMAWLRADTFSWQDGTVYSNAYNHLVADMVGKTQADVLSETIGPHTIYYYLADDGHKICTPDQETTVQNIYENSGVAWYYILDQANQRFKLPRENPNLEKYTKLTSASVAVKGNNGTINVMTSSGVRNLYIDGHPSGGSGQTCVNAAGAISPLKLSTDPNTSGIVGTADLSGASSNSFYKGKKYLYFYVGQFSQTATEQTAGLNSELFNGKMDLDLGNVPTTSKQTIVGWGVPDYSTLIEIPTTANYTWECPADGWVQYQGGTSGSSIKLNNANGLQISGYGGTSSVSGGDTLPVVKGQIYYFGNNCAWRHYWKCKGV